MINLSDEEKQLLIEITKKGIDLQELIKIIAELTETTLKPFLELYIKNVKAYLEIKNKGEQKI